MQRRAFLSGALAIAVLPTPLAVAAERKIKMALIWIAHDIEAIKISLIYDDGSSLVTIIPEQWWAEHPLEHLLILDGFAYSTSRSGKSNPTWTALCEGIVEEYSRGR